MSNDSRRRAGVLERSVGEGVKVAGQDVGLGKFRGLRFFGCFFSFFSIFLPWIFEEIYNTSMGNPWITLDQRIGRRKNTWFTWSPPRYPKISGEWMLVPLNMVIIDFNPSPYVYIYIHIQLYPHNIPTWCTALYNHKTIDMI